MSKINEAFMAEIPAQEHIYYNIHFSIDAGYVWGHGMAEDASSKFYDGMKSVFSAAGWTIEEPRSSSGCPTFRKGKNALYCHPMELSGPCELDLVDEVETLIESSKVCQYRFSKAYDQIYDITKEQYQAALDSVNDHVEADILAAFTTSRRSYYHPGNWPQLFEIARRYCIPTLDRYLGISSDDIFVKHVEDLFNRLVSEGKIIRKDDPIKGELYRSATRQDLIEAARKQAPSLNGKIQDAQQYAKDRPSQGREPTCEKGSFNERG